MAGEIQLRQTLARPYLPATQTPQVAYVLIEIVPTAAAANVQMPVNVAFVLDHSGSMRGNKLRSMKAAAGLALDRLSDDDTVAIVIFNHETVVLVPSQQAAGRDGVKRLINGIRDEGGTKIARALAAGLGELTRGPQGALPRLVLLTDGETDKDERECIAMADQAGASGIPITAFGVGNEWNDRLLTEIATRSHGEVEHLQRPEQIEDNFQAVVQQAQGSVFQNANATLRLVAGVQPRAAWQVVPLIKNLGYKPLAERTVVVPLEQLEKDNRRVLLFELMVEPKPAGQYRIGQLEVDYDIPQLGITGEKARADLVLQITNDQALTKQVNPQVMNIVEKVSAFKLQTRALDDIEAGNVAGATQKLQSAVTRLLNTGETDLAQTVQKEVQNLEQQGQLSSEGQKTIRFGSRKTVRLSDLDVPG
ncbi:MAG TPA: VWA domain-containing protein [Herpetosiphonaceae bacterium]|nr:VWA domain-containing protein [Herpetosiphonaceae bacterium]